MTKGNRPSRNFAPLPLAVLASDAPPRAKLLMLAIFHHDWDGVKAWPSQSRLALIMSCTVDTVQRATEDCRAQGWLTTRSGQRDQLTYEINVPDMNLKGFERVLTTKSRSRKLRFQDVAANCGPGHRKLRSGDTANCGTNREPLNENQEQERGSAADAAPPIAALPQPEPTRAEAVLLELDAIRQASHYGRPLYRAKGTLRQVETSIEVYGDDLGASYRAYLADRSVGLEKAHHPIAIFNAQPDTYHIQAAAPARKAAPVCPDCHGTGRVYRTADLAGEPCTNPIHGHGQVVGHA